MELSWQQSIESEFPTERNGKGKEVQASERAGSEIKVWRNDRLSKHIGSPLKLEEEYFLDRSEKWTRDGWLVQSPRFNNSGSVPKWFSDSTDSDIGSLKQYEVQAKICVCGDAAVGKTSFTQRYVSKMFRRSYKWTVGGKISNIHILFRHTCNIPGICKCF